jgi:hypothetical protein
MTFDNKFKTVVNYCKLVPYFMCSDDAQNNRLYPIPFFANDMDSCICNIFVKFDEQPPKTKSVFDKNYPQNLIYFYTDCLALKMKNSILNN